MSVTPKVELSFKLALEGVDAVKAMQWPLTLLFISIALCLLIVTFRVRPIRLARRFAAWLASL